jgi:hypothetical protein
MKVIKHIWRYLTDKDYRLKMYLTNLNRKYIKSYKKQLEGLYEEQPLHYEIP